MAAPWLHASNILVSATLDSVDTDVCVNSWSRMNSDRAARTFPAIELSQLVDLDGSRLGNFAGIETSRGDDIDRYTVVCITSNGSCSGDAGEGDERGEDGGGTNFNVRGV